MENTIIIIGASSLIARAISDLWTEHSPGDRQLLISRKPRDGSPNGYENKQWLYCDYSENHIASLSQRITSQYTDISHVFICNGILHQEGIQPEKRIESVSETQLSRVFHINTVIPSLWVSHLSRNMIKNKITAPCVMTVFSARIGSIEDNHSGGWYSYRSSKAALNMMLKTASVEFSRRLPNLKLISFHPGTTDTPLSKPFQSNVPADKLFSPQFVAKQLYCHVNNRDFDGTVDYIDWQGEPIAW